MSEFEKLLTSYQNRINSKLEGLLPSDDSILSEAIRYSVLGGGNRLRPILVYLIGELGNAKNDSLDILAGSVEIIHCYSLIHDDLPSMDDDDLRRGRPTLHVKYSESTAVLAGDAMASLAIDIILHDLNLSSDLKVELLQFLMKTIGPEGMILGQIQDITFENISVTEEEILKMNELKTGALVEFSMLAPVIIAGEDIKQWEKIA